MVSPSSVSFQIVTANLSPELPQNLGLFPVSDFTFNVTLWNLSNKTVFMDNGALNESVQTTLLFATGAQSLAAILSAAGYDAAIGGLPANAHGGALYVVSGEATWNCGGSDDGTGTNGFVVATHAPTAISPRKLGVGDVLRFGRYR